MKKVQKLKRLPSLCVVENREIKTDDTGDKIRKQTQHVG